MRRVMKRLTMMCRRAAYEPRLFFFFSSRRRHTRLQGDWSSDVCSSDLVPALARQPKEFLVSQMKAFQEGKRPATVMHQIAKGYTDAQIDLLAGYLSAQKK